MCVRRKFYIQNLKIEGGPYYSGMYMDLTAPQPIMGTTRSAMRRIQHEIEEAEKFPYFDLVPDPDNIMKWTAHIHDLPCAHRAGKKYTLELICPATYPLKAPKIRFLEQVDNFKYNDNETGRFCIYMLSHEWLPSYTLQGIVLYICSLLTDTE